MGIFSENFAISLRHPAPFAYRARHRPKQSGNVHIAVVFCKVYALVKHYFCLFVFALIILATRKHIQSVKAIGRVVNTPRERALGFVEIESGQISAGALASYLVVVGAQIARFFIAPQRFRISHLKSERVSERDNVIHIVGTREQLRSCFCGLLIVGDGMKMSV